MGWWKLWRLRKCTCCSEWSCSLYALRENCIFKSLSFFIFLFISRSHQTCSSLCQLELKDILVKSCCYIRPVILVIGSHFSKCISFVIIRYAIILTSLVWFVKYIRLLFLWSDWRFTTFIRFSNDFNLNFLVSDLILLQIKLVIPMIKKDPKF